MEERLISAHLQKEDESIDFSLRPRFLKEYIGQQKVKEHLTIFIEAAKRRKEALDHVLLYGPPGLGKTTLAHIIANEMGVNLKITSGPAIERQGDLAAILTNLQPYDVLFIDEIHRLNKMVEEILYPAMEDGVLDIIIGKGPSARSVRIELPKFTLVGATTRIGLLTAPLRDRFGVISHLQFYHTNDLCYIIERAAKILAVELEATGAEEIARRARGTPRVANRLLKRIRDYAEVKADGAITLDVARAGLQLLEIDELGLDQIDCKLLLTMIEKFRGRPVGVETLAAAIGEEAETIEDVYEPYLLQLGLIDRTPRGRVAAPLAYQHFHIAVQEDD